MSKESELSALEVLRFLETRVEEITLIRGDRGELEKVMLTFFPTRPGADDFLNVYDESEGPTVTAAVDAARLRSEGA